MQFLYNSQSHTITKADYHSIVILCYQNIITPNGWSHFWSQVKVENTYWVIYPSSKEVSPKIRAVRAITFYDAASNADLKIIAPPKPHFFWKKIDPGNFCTIFFRKTFFSVEEWKFANRLKRVLPKFRADPSHVRGVNSRSNFRKKITFTNDFSKR